MARLIARMTEDSNKVKTINALAWEYRRHDFKQALLYAEKGIKLAEKIKFARGIVEAYGYRGVIMRNLGDYEAALSDYLASIKIAQDNQFTEYIAYGHNNIGEIYSFQQKYNEAIAYIEKAIQIFEKAKDKKGMGYAYIRMGEVLQAQGKYEDALVYYQKCARVREKERNKLGIAVANNRIGDVYLIQEKTELAIKTLEEAMTQFKQTNDKRGLSNNYADLARAYVKNGQTSQAITCANQGLELAKKLPSFEFIRDCSDILYKIYASKKNYNQAFEYQSMLLIAKDSLQREEFNLAFMKLHSHEIVRQKETEIALKKNEIELKEKQKIIDNDRFRILTVAFSGAVVLIGLAVFFLISLQTSNQARKKINRELEHKNIEIKQQHTKLVTLNEALDLKNNEITSSIQYAYNIQKAHLPRHEDIVAYLPKHFILYKPRDIVSGDFYWFTQKEAAQTADKHERTIVVAGDCTGHGVPGAFMSMIAESILNQIVHDTEIHAPASILKELHKKVQRNLNQFQTKNRDGMDISICTIIPELAKMEYAGAGNSLIYIQERCIFEVKANISSVGGYQKGTEINYVGHEIDLSKPTSFYIYSDGYQDQFGGEKGRKFMTNRFRKVLYDIHLLDTALQEEILDEIHLEWRNRNTQTDDVLVFGVQLPAFTHSANANESQG